MISYPTTATKIHVFRKKENTNEMERRKEKLIMNNSYFISNVSRMMISKCDMKMIVLNYMSLLNQLKLYDVLFDLFQYLKQLMTLIVASDVEQMKSFTSKSKRNRNKCGCEIEEEKQCSVTE